MDKNELWDKLSEDSREMIEDMFSESKLNDKFDIKAMFYDLYSRGAEQCKGVADVEEYMEVISPDKYARRNYEMYELDEVKMKTEE